MATIEGEFRSGAEQAIWEERYEAVLRERWYRGCCGSRWLGFDVAGACRTADRYAVAGI
jgi:hypothetical protein